MNGSDPDSGSLLRRALESSRGAPLAAGLDLYRRAQAAARKAGRTVEVARALVEEARARAGAFEASQIARAHELLDEAQALLVEEPDPTVAATLLHVRGYTWLRGGRQARAAAVLREAERACHDAGDVRGEARVLDTLGVLWERRGDRERAALLLARSHALKHQAGDARGVAITLGNLGRLALHGGKLEEAAQFFRLDLDLAREQGDPRGEALVLTNLAECAVGAGALDAARAHAEGAREVAAAIDDPVLEGFALLSLADVERAAGRLDSSLAHIDAAESLFRRAGNPAGQAHARVRRAHTHAAAGRDEASGRAAIGAARAAGIARLPDLVIEASLEAHRAFETIGQRSRARRCLRRAQEAAIQSGLEDLVRRVRATQRGFAVRQATEGSTLRVTLDLAVEGLAAQVGSTMELRAEGVLGQGAFALVLLVRDTDTGARYALKRLHHDAERLRALERRLRREFTAMTRVPADAAVVHPVAFGHEDGQPCLLMEYVEPLGTIGSLADLMEGSGAVDPLRVARLGIDIAHGLAAIHAAGVVHRDLKPENVLLARDGRARVADYGLAYDLNEDEYVPEEGFKGSLGYAAPELFRVAEGSWSAPTPAADLYALGVLLHQLFVGTWPFANDGSVLGVVRGKLAGPPAQAAMHGVPQSLRPLVAGLLEPEPGERTADAAWIADQLETWVADGVSHE